MHKLHNTFKVVKSKKPYKKNFKLRRLWAPQLAGPQGCNPGNPALSPGLKVMKCYELCNCYIQHKETKNHNQQIRWYNQHTVTSNTKENRK